MADRTGTDPNGCDNAKSTPHIKYLKYPPADTEAILVGHSPGVLIEAGNFRELAAATIALFGSRLKIMIDTSH